MPKYLVILLSLLLTSAVFAQEGDTIPSMFPSDKIPADFDPADVDPEDIPNERVLRSMGLSEAQIKMALQRKRQAEKNKDVFPGIDDELEQSAKPKRESDKKAASKDKVLIEGQPEKTYPEGVIYGQEVFRNNRIGFYEKAQDVKAPESYVIGPGDEINVAVWGFSDYNNVFTVDDQGYIHTKPAGRIYVKGMTFKNARSLIRQKMGTFLDLQRSQFDITLTYSRVINVNIVGEVFNPGSYTIPAINTAFNALVVSGGPQQIGSVRNIHIKRDGNTVDSLDVYNFLMDPAGYDQTYLQDNDYIVVPIAGKVVEIYGEVRRPHRYELKANENIHKLIDFAGGLKAMAYKSNIQVKRYEQNEEVLIDVDLDSLKQNGVDFPLQDGDEVMVHKIPEGYMNTVTAKGAVRIPGDFQLKQGERVSDLLKKTEGLLYHAYLQRAYIVRLNDDFSKTYISIDVGQVLENENAADNILLQEFDEFRVFSKKDFEDDFVVSVHGAVRKPDTFEFGKDLSLKDALIMAGGLKGEAANKRIEVSRIVNYNEAEHRLEPKRAVVYTMEVSKDLGMKQAEEYLLQPYDQIFVRVEADFDVPKTVHLTGEVYYPGEYALLRKDEKVSDLISRAGGLREYAFMDGVTMVREGVGKVYLDLEKALNKTDSKHNLVLYEDDSIHVPKTLDLVYITGEVGNITVHSISAPYFGRRAKYYINNFAGGFTSQSLRRGTYVIYPNGIIRKTRNFGLFKIYPRVKKGSVIKVMKKEKPDPKDREPVDWNKVIENTTIKLTAVLTLWVLIQNVTK